MFSIGFTKDDVKRVVWTFVQAFLGAVGTGLILASQNKLPTTWSDARTVVVGIVLAALAAAVSAVKNLVLEDGSALK
jgi:hypothetical protein